MKVFLSSTAVDLVAYRQVADNTILQLCHQAVVMERFGPLPGEPVEECERKAQECDVLVCIVAHRYGSEPEPGKGSVTRREVEAARAAGRSILAWIVDDDQPWSAKKEQDRLTDPTVSADMNRVASVARSVQALADFKTWLRSTFVCDTFTTPDDLGRKIAIALSNYWGQNKGQITPPYISLNNLKNSGINKFVGRRDALSQLHEKLQESEKGSIFTLTGMAGIGKTELALQYAWREWKKGTYLGGVCWVNVKSNDPSFDIINFFEHKLKLGEPRGSIAAEIVQECWSNWPNGDVLIVFDDVQNIHQILEYLPPYESKRFKVVITTRCEYLSDVIGNIHLGELSEDASLDLLRSYIDKDRINLYIEEAKLLCDDLGYLPLALELIGRLLRRRAWKIKDVRDKLRERGLKDKSSLLSKSHPEMTAKYGVKAAFGLSWDELEDEPKIQELALYLSLFAVAPIQQVWINELFPDENVDDIEEWLIDSLVNLNLVKSAGENQYELHRLIHLYLREKLDESALLTSAKKRYCKLLILKCEKFSPILSPVQIEELTPIVPHIKQITAYHYEYIDDNYNHTIPSNWNLPIKAINSFYVSQGFYPQAIQYFQEYLECTRERFGEDDIHLMVIYNDFALVLKDRGRYAEALELLEQARTIAIKYLDENHHETMMISNAIGDTYRQMGEYEKAKEILSKLLPHVLPQNLFSQGIENVYISALNLCVPNNLGLVYGEMKKYEEAETFFKLVLSYLEGKDEKNLHYTQAAINLAGILIELKRYQEAEMMLVKALRINKLILDPKQLIYRLNLSKLVVLFIIKNKLEDAEKLLLELFELQLNLACLEFAVMECFYHIVSQYFYQGLYEKVEEVSLKINKLYHKFQLTNSIEYCKSLNLLAQSYTRVARFEEASKLLREAIDIEQILLHQTDKLRIVDSSDISFDLTTSDSFQTFGMVLWNLAQKFIHPTHFNQRRSLLLEAERCTKYSLELCQIIYKQKNDANTHDMLSAINNNLGLIFEDLEKYAEAENSYKIALRLRREEHGNEHYLVGQSLLNLAACYDWQKKNADAVENMLLECKVIWEKLFQSNHPEMIHCYEHLAKFYSRIRKFKEAINYYQKTIDNCHARQADNISFYQQRMEECIKQSKKLMPRKTNLLSKKTKGFG